MRRWACVFAVAAFLTVSAEGCGPPPLRALPDPLYGVTFDNASGASQSKIDAHKTAIAGLDAPLMPISRVVFDEGVDPSEYTAWVDGLYPVSHLMGELLDSSALADITVAEYQARTVDYLAAFKDKVAIWEVGNEIGGAWAGSNASQAQKIAVAFDEVEAAQRRSGLTLWYNVGCEDGSELTPLEFTDQYVPARMKTGLEYVFVSYYEVPCNNFRPSVSTWRTFFQQLHARYPNARLGFGEIGLEQPVQSGTLSKAQSIANYYYPLPLFDLTYYVGGHFWWYAAQDVVPWPDWMGDTIKEAMS